MIDLAEGLRENDLEDLVLPVLSIDEYESKIDDDGIVVGFYTLYKDPANDLNRFIQKSSINILDTEVSPAPTEDGYYVVFVEMERKSDFPQSLIELLSNLNNLVGFDQWQFKTIDVKEIHKLDQDKLKELIRLMPQNDQSNESLEEFFKHSILDNLIIKGNDITFVKNTVNESYKLVAYCDYNHLVQSDTKLIEGLQLKEAEQRTVRKLQALLGPHWLIEHLVSVIVLSHPLSNNAVLLKT